MRSRFLLIPAYALVASAPVHATVYLSVEQAQALMFPGATLTPDFVTLTPEQMKAIEKACDVNVLTPNLKAWRVSTGGWFIADQVVGKHEFIPFAVAIDAQGAVRSVEILEYRETFGDQVRNEAWRAQFVGKTHDAPLKLNSDIKNISGATLSSRHITDGVKRLLTTYALVLAAPHG
ncbi:FMN-binding domain-containing protein [Dyella sp. OK004]|uniref:FMN-binding protein n=1 Tax=Dyella sp. OK004 TaxID=1855292 RepID=UPI0008EB5B40|nr:FMN-binding protein [Dyella sp. OK004]SFS08715.1 FMN-binding domain-containing protein [Dyella sp. OK004]